MEKLSRVDRYRDYRNQLNNEADKEIATKELQEIRDKIILNEKRFGNSSRTESDLNTGRRNSYLDSILNLNNRTIDNSESSNNDSNSNINTDTSSADVLDDIFAELKNYKQHPTNNNRRDDDEYLKKIKDLVNRNFSDENTVDKEEKNLSKDNPTDNFIYRNEEKENVIENSYIPNEEEIVPEPEAQLPEEDIFEQPQETFIENEQKNDTIDESQSNSDDSLLDEIKADIDAHNNNEENIQEEQKEDLAEFEPEPIKYVGPQLQDVVIEKPVITIPKPQQDLSAEFKEICDAVNTLAEEIEEANSFSQEEKINAPNISVNSSIENIQQDIKIDLVNSGSKEDFMSTLQQEVDSFEINDLDSLNSESNDKKTVEQKHVIKKSEVSGHLKEEYDNTVSLEVNKIMDEINSSKPDTISASDMMNSEVSKAKDILTDHPGETIAFEFEKKKDIPDNTVILSNPKTDDSSIHTMSFKTDEIDEKDEKGSTLLNVILSILIIIAVGALGVIIYFFLITRGII